MNHMNTATTSQVATTAAAGEHVHSTDNAAASKPYSLREKLEAAGEKLGEFRAYDTQLPVADIAGSRIVKCLYQVSPKTNKKLRENSYVRIPTAHITAKTVEEKLPELMPHFISYLQGVEDSLIKSQHKEGGTFIYVEGLSLEKVLAELEKTNESARLNKEIIESWFASELESNLAEKFAEKLGISADSDHSQLVKLEKILEAYKAKFCSLASPKTLIPEADRKAMIGVIRSCAEDSENLTGISLRLVSRLEKMEEKKEEILISL